MQEKINKALILCTEVPRYTYLFGCGLRSEVSLILGQILTELGGSHFDAIPQISCGDGIASIVFSNQSVIKIIHVENAPREARCNGLSYTNSVNSPIARKLLQLRVKYDPYN